MRVRLISSRSMFAALREHEIRVRAVYGLCVGKACVKSLSQGHGPMLGSFCGQPSLEVLEQICWLARLRHSPAQTLSQVTKEVRRVRTGLTQGSD
jgi:hypothetical protein